MNLAIDSLYALISFMTFPTIMLGVLWIGGLLFNFDFAKNQNLVHNLIKVYVVCAVVGVVYALTRPSLTDKREADTSNYRPHVQQVAPVEPVSDRTRQPKMTDAERAEHYKQLSDYKTKDQ